jgi:hypothetical protein
MASCAGPCRRSLSSWRGCRTSLLPLRPPQPRASLIWKSPSMLRAAACAPSTCSPGWPKPPGCAARPGASAAPRSQAGPVLSFHKTADGSGGLNPRSISGQTLLLRSLSRTNSSGSAFTPADARFGQRCMIPGQADRLSQAWRAHRRGSSSGLPGVCRRTGRRQSPSCARLAPESSQGPFHTFP